MKKKKIAQDIQSLSGTHLCLWCINSGSPPPVVFPIVGATAGIMGCIQVLEAIKYLSGIGSNMMGTLLIYDGTTMDFNHLPQKKAAGCPVCGGA